MSTTPIRRLGDFNGNGALDAADIDVLRSEVSRRQNNIVYDLDFDGRDTVLDVTHWVKNLANTYFGDSNLDGKFDSIDLVAVNKEDGSKA